MRTDMGTGASTWLLNCVDGTPINGIDEMAPDDAGGIYCGTADLDAIIKGERKRQEREARRGELFGLLEMARLANSTEQRAHPNRLSLS